MESRGYGYEGRQDDQVWTWTKRFSERSIKFDERHLIWLTMLWPWPWPFSLLFIYFALISNIQHTGYPTQRYETTTVTNTKSRHNTIPKGINGISCWASKISQAPLNPFEGLLIDLWIPRFGWRRVYRWSSESSIYAQSMVVWMRITSGGDGRSHLEAVLTLGGNNTPHTQQQHPPPQYVSSFHGGAAKSKRR